MSPFNKDSALAMIEAFRTADITAADSLSGVASLDQTRIAKESELRQSVLAVLGASIEADLCPAQALVVLQQMGAYLSGAALRVAYEGDPVPIESVKAMADYIVEVVAQGAGYAKSSTASHHEAAPPTHSTHQTRQ